jgi:hypothetical protein
VINSNRIQAATESFPTVRESATGFVKVKVGATMSGDFDPDLSRFTSLNPLTVGYELIPFSFVFDWLFDLGSYMRNLETSLLFNSSYRWGYISTLVSVNYEMSFLGKTVDSGNGNYYTYGASARKKIVSFERLPGVSYPVPQFPQVDLNLGSSRLLSAASLLRQLIK